MKVGNEIHLRQIAVAFHHSQLLRSNAFLSRLADYVTAGQVFGLLPAQTATSPTPII
jgi:hypothetical protein